MGGAFPSPTPSILKIDLLVWAGYDLRNPCPLGGEAPVYPSPIALDPYHCLHLSQRLNCRIRIYPQFKNCSRIWNGIYILRMAPPKAPLRTPMPSWLCPSISIRCAATNGLCPLPLALYRLPHCLLFLGISIDTPQAQHHCIRHNLYCYHKLRVPCG